MPVAVYSALTLLAVSALLQYPHIQPIGVGESYPVTVAVVNHPRSEVCEYGDDVRGYCGLGVLVNIGIIAPHGTAITNITSNKGCDVTYSDDTHSTAKIYLGAHLSGCVDGKNDNGNCNVSLSFNVEVNECTRSGLVPIEVFMEQPFSDAQSADTSYSQSLLSFMFSCTPSMDVEDAFTVTEIYPAQPMRSRVCAIDRHGNTLRLNTLERLPYNMKQVLGHVLNADLSLEAQYEASPSTDDLYGKVSGYETRLVPHPNSPEQWYMTTTDSFHEVTLSMDMGEDLNGPVRLAEATVKTVRTLDFPLATPVGLDLIASGPLKGGVIAIGADLDANNLTLTYLSPTNTHYKVSGTCTEHGELKVEGEIYYAFAGGQVQVLWREWSNTIVWLAHALDSEETIVGECVLYKRDDGSIAADQVTHEGFTYPIYWAEMDDSAVTIADTVDGYLYAVDTPKFSVGVGDLDNYRATLALYSFPSLERVPNTTHPLGYLGNTFNYEVLPASFEWGTPFDHTFTFAATNDGGEYYAVIDTTIGVVRLRDNFDGHAALDCANVIDGDAQLDSCGVCNGNNDCKNKGNHKSNTKSDDDSDSSSGSSVVGAAVGGTIGGLAGVGAVAGVVYYYKSRGKKTTSAGSPTTANTAASEKTTTPSAGTSEMDGMYSRLEPTTA